MIGIWDLLLHDNAELIERGASSENIDELRFRYTGHRRPLSLEWARSIGAWGGVASVPAISALTGKTKQQV